MQIRYLLAWSLTSLLTACGGGGAASTGSATGQTFWLPFAGYSQSGGTLHWDLGVISSSLSNTTLQPVPIGQFKRTIGLLSKSTTRSASPSAPFAVVYLATGPDGNDHLYALDLADTSAVPTPKQISSLSIPPAFASCLTAVYPLPLGGSDALDPTSAGWVLMGASVAPGATFCANTPLLLVHYTDSPATAPIALPASVATFPVATLCSGTGQLSGLISMDTVHNLTLYRTINDWKTSTNAVPIISGVMLANGGVAVEYDRAGRPRPEGCTLFVPVQDVATGASLLYRVDSTGNASRVYQTNGQLQFGLDAVDNTDVYFMDAVTVGSQTSYTLVKQPIDGSPSTRLYSTSPTPSTQWYTPIDTDGTDVLLYLVDNTTTPANVSLLTLPANAPSVPALVAGSVTGAFLDFQSDHLFVTQGAGSGPTSSFVYTPSNPVPVLSQPNSAFVPNYDPWNSSGRVVQLRNLPADGTWAGASLYSLTTDTLTAAPMTQNGIAYITPTGTTSLSLNPAFGTIAFGDVRIGSTSSGLVVDFSKNDVITISVPGEQLVPFYEAIFTP